MTLSMSYQQLSGLVVRVSALKLVDWGSIPSYGISNYILVLFIYYKLALLSKICLLFNVDQF